MAGLNFNAETVAPNQAFENLAPAWYTAMITDSTMKATKGGDGSYLEIELEVVAPAQFAGRKLWDRLNLNNPNEKAVEIAYQTLSAICHATGVIQVQDSQQLHNIPMDVKVGMSKVTEQYPEPRNEVKGYRPVQGGGNVGGAPQAMGAPQAPQGAPQAPQGAPQAAAQAQAPQQQQWQQPQQAPQQTEAPVTTYNQAPQNAAPQQQEQAPQQGGWQNAAPQQAAPQQQAQAPQQQADLPPAEQHPQTDPAGQAAAQADVPPWLANQQG
ncbi:MAG: hypothetical protein CMO80_22050 [Verrucomicrobiales bacterium]|nr:hypothetical protein [Verrucomicrobiales bacterium]|tara:strand:- start:11895 stop:12698 length:804 start_codon:yes stop_codon:yes gene_type:complete